MGRARCIEIDRGGERCRYRYTERGIVGEMERYIVIDREGDSGRDREGKIDMEGDGYRAGDSKR